MGIKNLKITLKTTLKIEFKQKRLSSKIAESLYYQWLGD